jgi:hypothetical protein
MAAGAGRAQRAHPPPTRLLEVEVCPRPVNHDGELGDAADKATARFWWWGQWVYGFRGQNVAQSENQWPHDQTIVGAAPGQGS